MKAVRSSFTAFLIAYTTNGKSLWINLFVVSILVANIVSHLFVFPTYKLTYEAGALAAGHLLVFWIAAISPVILVLAIIKWRSDSRRSYKRHRKAIQKEMLQLETRALNAQMNPHFIFNCISSIKLLIQQKEEHKAITYLTAFSKLLRTILQNTDKKEITLFEEIETCRIYAQLESMRFGDKLSCSFAVDESIDLKSIKVPALTIQPFIENAIWHGIMPKEEGGNIRVIVSKQKEKICCMVEDDGIGRKPSMQNKGNGSPSTHQSKGVKLTQSRLELSNVLNKRNATVEIVDKTDENEKSAGTKVILVFNEE